MAHTVAQPVMRLVRDLLLQSVTRALPAVAARRQRATRFVPRSPSRTPLPVTNAPAAACTAPHTQQCLRTLQLPRAQPRTAAHARCCTRICSRTRSPIPPVFFSLSLLRVQQWWRGGGGGCGGGGGVAVVLPGC
ncbi:unnamed protein product [Closterium sp. NIES-54]